MILVVDASVAVKWFLGAAPGEAGADIAIRILKGVAAGEFTLVQPPHFHAEVGAVLARLKPRQAAEDMSDLMQIETLIVDTPEVHVGAVELAVELDAHVFDTLYHAVALQTPGALLVTADERYLRRAHKRGSIVALREFAPG